MHLARKQYNAIVTALLISVLISTSFVPLIGHAQSSTPSPQPTPTSETPTPLAQTPASVNFCQDPGTCISGLVYILPAISADIAFVVAYVFDVFVKLSLDSNGYAIDFLKTGWGTAQGLANIAFLFILIYIAITILFQAETGGTMRMLTTLIVMALLVNFSFLMTRVVIDVGNILAVEFYNGIDAPTFGATGSTAATYETGILQNVIGVNPISIKDLTNPIMQAVNLQDMFNTTTFSNWAKYKGTGLTGVLTEIITLSTLFIAIAVIYWILIFAFTTAGIKFLVRTIFLWFVLMLAPLAFAARVLTKSSNWFDKWFDYLIQFSIYPAAFLFMFLILVKTINGMMGSNVAQELFDPNSSLFVGLANLFIRMGIVIAMLYFGFQAVDNVAKEGNKYARFVTDKASGKLREWGSKLPQRTAGYAYQNTVGRGAEKLDSTLKGTEWGNNRFGYALRTNITKPLANKSVGGVESRTALTKRMGIEQRERTDNLRDIENKKIIARVIQGNGSADDFERIDNLNPRELGILKKNDVLSMIGLFDKKKIQSILKNKKWTDADRVEISNAWTKWSDILNKKKGPPPPPGPTTPPPGPTTPPPGPTTPPPPPPRGPIPPQPSSTPSGGNTPIPSGNLTPPTTPPPPPGYQTSWPVNSAGVVNNVSPQLIPRRFSQGKSSEQNPSGNLTPNPLIDDLVENTIEETKKTTESQVELLKQIETSQKKIDELSSKVETLPLLIKTGELSLKSLNEDIRRIEGDVSSYKLLHEQTKEGNYGEEIALTHATNYKNSQELLRTLSQLKTVIEKLPDDHKLKK